MSIKTPNSEILKISKLPLVATHNYNQRHIYKNNNKRNNSKKMSEINNFGKLSGSYQNKTKYKFRLSSINSTIEANKNTSENDSYQNQFICSSNITCEKNKEILDPKEKLTVNKTNLKGAKANVDKNKSFIEIRLYGDEINCDSSGGVLQEKKINMLGLQWLSSLMHIILGKMKSPCAQAWWRNVY